ncbi:MAG: copper-binding protein [Phycisphaeraceae bacterium]
MFLVCRPLVLTALIALPLGLTACDQASSEQPAVPAADAEAARIDTYTVRGQVVTLPTETNRQVQVAHEAIPGFKNKAGEVVGMSTMTMPFPVNDAISLDGVDQGDAIELVFSVNWQSADYTVTSITELPEGTELDLSSAGHDMSHDDHSGHDHSGHDHDHAGHAEDHDAHADHEEAGDHDHEDHSGHDH